MYPRRFPAPWKIEERRESYVVTDGHGQHIAYVCFGLKSGLSKEDAERIARAITIMPNFLLKRDDFPSEHDWI
jgi:hypothetical protein